jgi:shikimate kinase
MADRIVVLGMMASGKTTVGEALARELGRPYLDNDELLERATGRTAREIAHEGSTASMRAAERAALEEAGRIDEPVVVGAAGGTVLDPADRALLRKTGRVVWLRARPETLLARVLKDAATDTGGHRPWVDDTPAAADAWIRREVEQRARLYATVADLIVDVERADGSSKAPDEIAAEIATALGEQPTGPREQPGGDAV